jgi:hypothetical protein
MIIDYSMTKDYRSHWSIYDAVREMVQNAVDSGYEFECSIDYNYICVTTRGTTLDLATLALGESNKPGSESIGRYGEGYKIGMLILARSGNDPQIVSDGKMFQGYFSQSPLGLETFKIQVTEYGAGLRKIAFRCSTKGFDIKELKRRIPYFTETPLATPASVNILEDRPGEIFVNGLYVCSKALTFGYNFHPSNISLNTDRNMVEGVNWQLGQFYGSLGIDKAELIFNLIENDANDVVDLSYWLSNNNKLKAELARLFYLKYGTDTKISTPGNYYSSSAVSTSTNAGRVYIACGISEAPKKPSPDAPHVVLEEFICANKKHLRRDVRRNLAKLVERSKGWRKSL